MNCQVNKKCGSCQYIEMKYDKQLQLKYEEYKDIYKDFHVKIHPIQGMKNPYGYRNKVIVAFNQKYEYGLYEENSHRIVPIQKCLLHDQETHDVLNQLQLLFKKNRISIYDSKRKRGLLKHVLIRRAVSTNQTLVVLVVNEPMFKGSKRFCQELTNKCPTVKSVVLNINSRQTSVVLSKNEKVLYGKGFIVDELCGLTFKISAQSFYQINHSQCEKLYQKVIDLLDVKKEDTILDTYCGIGTIGMVVSKYVDRVIGVELNKEAYKDALNNAKMNRIENIKFYNDDATEFMKKQVALNQKVDGVIMDPPRAGSTKEFIHAIQVLNPRYVIYVSCDPHTQVNDLKEFQKIGYSFKDVYLYDMFPHTQHVECVVLLTKVHK